ncbi:MAG: type II secretion system protein GspG, partial [Planctomycetes bacterium]|nr:type II secretion system protein GspG [Planctomycetota bacterium]
MILLQACLSVPLLLPIQETTPAAEGRELLSLDCRGIDALFVSEKDAKLHSALRMLDDRLRELPGEMGGGPMPEGVFPVLRRVLEGPMSLRVFGQERQIAGMMLPLFGELRLSEQTPSDAQGLADGLAETLRSIGLDVDPTAGSALSVIPAPLPLWMGSRDRDLVVRFGKEADLAAPAPGRYMPDGAKAAITMRMDYSGALDMVRHVAEVAGEGEELEQMDMMLEQFGLTDMAFEYSYGFDDQRAYEVVATEGYGAMMRAMHMAPAGALDAERVRWIPEDASWAVVSRIDLSGYVAFLNQMFRDMPDSGGLDLLEMVHQQTGIDVQTELLDTLGQHFMMYGSDSTGGGGLMSTVMVMDLVSPEEFGAFMDQMVGMIGGMAAAQSEGYVQLRGWSEGGQHFTSLQTPGIPAPMEPTMAIVGNAAVFAMTPQAALAASRQIQSGKRSLLDQRALTDQLPEDMTTAISLIYLDSARFMRDGYGMTSMLCSAIANGVRSRDGERDPGMILPAYNDLARGAKALVGVGHLRGDAMVAEYRADRSHLVNIAGVLGWVAEVPGPIVAMAVAGMAASEATQASGGIHMDDFGMEEYEEPELSAEEIEAWEKISEIYEALDVYASSNDGKYPSSLAELAKPDAQGNQYLASVPVDPWGYPYEYEAPTDEGGLPYVWSKGIDELDDGGIMIDVEFDEIVEEEAVEEPVIKDA